MSRYLQYIKEVLFLLGDNRKKIPWLMVLFFSSSILDLAGIGLIAPYIALIVNPEIFVQSAIYSFFISIGISSEPEELLVTLGLVLLAVFVIKAISAILINRTILRFCFQQSVELRSLLMNSYQNLSYTNYLQRNSSEYIYHIQQLAPQFSQSILMSFLNLTKEGIVGLLILILLAWSNGLALGLLVLLLGGMIFIYDRLFRHNIRMYGRLSNEHSTRMVQGIHEGIEGLKEIRILGKEAYFHKVVYDGAKGYSEVSVKHQVITGAPRFLLEVILVTFVVLLVFGSLILDYNLETLLPTLSMFGVASMRLAPSTTQIITGITQIRFGRHAVNLLYSDLKQMERKPVLKMGM